MKYYLFKRQVAGHALIYFKLKNQLNNMIKAFVPKSA